VLAGIDPEVAAVLAALPREELALRLMTVLGLQAPAPPGDD
jgi:hypothetical protein